MPRRAFLLRCISFLALTTSLAVSQSPAAELAILSPENWEEFAPQGKEVDAIYGDIVLRNKHIVAVIAQPLVTRNANMTVKNVGGCLIDFTTRKHQNDQLSAFFPLGKATNWRAVTTLPEFAPKSQTVQADEVAAFVSTVIKEGELTAETRYVLDDKSDHLIVVTIIMNETDKPVKFTAKDETRTDGTGFVKGTVHQGFTWAYDHWWNASYGFETYEASTASTKDPNTEKQLDIASLDGKQTIPVYGYLAILRRLSVADDLRTLQELTAPAIVKGSGVYPPMEKLVVKQSDGIPAAGAYVEVWRNNKLVTAGRTTASGSFEIPKIHARGGHATAVVSSPAHAEFKIEWTKPTQEVMLPAPGTVVATVTDDAGKPIPCKVQFRGTGDTKDPVFFDRSGEHAVGNLFYSHNGQFTLPMPPGTYDCTVSYGTEWDIATQSIEVLSGSQTPLAAKLIHSVKTPGFISADFHSHSSPSGDNTSSQFGRVLNLLCENIEYAPCTEHNRISSYTPHLKRLGVEHLMGTSIGIELTSTPLPISHLNAFPLKMHSHTQDNGAPLPDGDPDLQVARLALWDDRSEKLIQQNHPDIGWLFFDKNGDGKPDGGHADALPRLDVIEVHPPQNIFKPALLGDKSGAQRNNTIFNWLQLLNQGWRLPGVVNTDAHYNIHGSGWLRIYLESPTDDPAKVETLDIVHAAEHGHIVMTNGPYLEVRATTKSGDKQATDGPGGDLLAPDGNVTLSVKVQCPNWFDVDRVQVFINGRPDPKLNFTRESTPDAFGQGVVKFHRELQLKLPKDAHIIVATIGEKSGLGYVMGPEHENDKPCAVSNPIYIDVDGGGFTANKDTLDAPLPVKSAASK